jgi:Tfp pilus assembly protein PilX
MKRNDLGPANQEGSALVIVMFSLLIMSTIGLSLAFSIEKDVNSSSNELLANQAYYAAEAGLEDALDVIRGNRCPRDSSDNCASTASARNHINLTIAATATSSNISGDTVTYPRLSRWLTYSSQEEGGVVVLNPTQSVNNRLSYQLKIERIGTDVQVTSTGFAPLGARRTLKLRLTDSSSAISDYNLGDIPAVITLLGDSPTGTAGNSAAHSLTGVDCGTGEEKPILGAVGGTNAQHLWENSFTGNKTNTWDTNLPVSGTTGVVADISTPNAAMHVTGKIPFDNNAANARAFITAMKKVAHTVVADGGSMPSGALGTADAPKIVVAEGDLSLHDGGAGILIVQGDLTLNGNFSYDGLIFVLGTGQLRRNGGGNGEIRGGVLVGAFTDGSNTFNLPAEADTGGGGNSLIRYCSDAISKAIAAIPSLSVKAYSGN